MSFRLLRKPVSEIFRNFRLVSTPIINTTNQKWTSGILPCNFHTAVPNYTVKRKSKGNDNKTKKNTKVEINNAEISTLVDIDSFKVELENFIERLQNDYVKYVSLRSSAGSIESMSIIFEDKKYELQELAQVVRKNPKTIVLNMVSFPQAIPAVLQAMQNSGLNLNPQQDGTTVFIPVPKVTTEHREALTKNAKALYIKCRDSLKNTENTYAKKVRNQKENVSEDTVFRVLKQLTAVTEQYVLRARELLTTKAKELTGKP